MSVDEAAMRETLGRWIAAQRRWNQLNDVRDEIVTGPSAATAALEALGRASPFPLPRSYIQLLRVHDGVRGLYRQGGDVLSSAYRFEHDAQWGECVRTFKLPRLFFFAMDNDGSAAGLHAGGVVEIFNYREVIEYRDLDDFLTQQRDMVEEWVAKQPVDP